MAFQCYKIALYTCAMNRITLRTDRLKPFLQRHSWVFSGAVASITHKDSVGIAQVEDEHRRLIGFGFTDPQSQIVCRIFHFGPGPEDGFGPGYWASRFQNALHLRQQTALQPGTNSYRLLHAEGDLLPGLVVDVYGGKTAVLHTLMDATRQWCTTWNSILQNLGYEAIYHKHDHEKAGRWLSPKSDEPVLALENGLRFEIDIEKGQKTGFFIDQRDNRAAIGALSKGKKVLNAFGFTGGFSVYALAGGAKEVITADISAEACKMAHKNVLINGLDESKHTTLAVDCFDYLKTMPDDFDLIVLDPPAFTKSKATVEKATRGYKEINLSALRKIKAGGLLATFSCSQHIDAALFQKIVFGAVADSGRTAQIIRHFYQPACHPVNICHPESEYLKGLLLYVI